jgi:hypothetical protein
MPSSRYFTRLAAPPILEATANCSILNLKTLPPPREPPDRTTLHTIRVCIRKVQKNRPLYTTAGKECKWKVGNFFANFPSSRKSRNAKLIHRDPGFSGRSSGWRQFFYRPIVIDRITPPVVVKTIRNPSISRQMTEPPLHEIQMVRFAPGVAVYHLLFAGEIWIIEPVVGS